MKLFTRYNRINLLSTVIIFLLGCGAFSFLLRYVIISQIDEDLRIEKHEIVTYVQRFQRLPSIIEARDQITNYAPVSAPAFPADKIYSKEIYKHDEREKELRRIIEFNINVNGAWFLVDVSKSLKGTTNLIQTIILITVAIILLMLAVTFFINRIVLRRLWQPFYGTLQRMKLFKLSNNDAMDFGDTKIEEFNYLNSILKDALGKAQQDYQSLKEFTENASHELQTPLAVIQSKLDILIQSEKLSESESQAIQSAYHAVQGLSKLNQSLLLLTKIENKQFSERSAIDIRASLQNKINQFSELWKSRNIVTRTDLSDKIITGNTYLVDILLNNLLSNATKHNFTNGSINIILNGDLQISNTGIEHSLDEQQLYKRFAKENKTADNQGLGLSIIHQICINSGYHCMYNFNTPNMHSFTINW